MEDQVRHGRIDQPSTTKADIRRQSSTTIDQFASSCIDSIFHPWKYGKDPTRNGGEIGGPKMGFQIADNSYAQMNGEDARRWQRKLAVQTRAFSSYCSSQWVSQRDLSPLQAPKPLGLESQVLHVQVALGDGYLLNPKWRRYGQNWRHIVG